MATKKNSTQTKPEKKTSSWYRRLNPKNYTVVPVEEYLDTSGKTKSHWDALIEMLFYLHTVNVQLGIPTGESFFYKNGLQVFHHNVFPFYSPVKIIKMKNGEFALHCCFIKNADSPIDDMEQIEKILTYDQNYFGDFIMPLIKRRNEWILERHYYAFLYDLYFEDVVFKALHFKWEQIHKEKAKAIKLQQYEECARLRDEEKVVEEKIRTFLLPIIEKNEKLNREDFMVYWQVFADNFPEYVEL